MNRIANILLLGVSLLFLSGCDRDEPMAEPLAMQPSLPFDSASVLLISGSDTVPVTVEIAESPEQRSLGLMRRTSLDANSGMLFIFETEQPPEEAFWMYNTLIPLSIAFVGEDGLIGSIREMEPCDSPYSQWCPMYAAGVPFHSGLEVNPGFFSANGIDVGDEVVLSRE